MQFKADISDTIAAEILYLQDDFIPGPVVLDGVVFRELAPDHQLDEPLLVRFPNVQRVNVLAVSQDGNTVTDFKELVQTVGDVDHRDTPGLQLTDYIEQAFLFLYRDRCRRLIQDQNTGIPENCFADLHDLAVRHGEISDPGSWGNMALEFLQKLLGLLITLRFVHEEAVIAPIAHE